jgi:DNA recombination protein RmuC
MASAQREQFDSFGQRITRLTESNEQRLELVRSTVDTRLKAIQDDNAVKLEKMRQTVDEKLQGTLDKRLGDSFKIVSDRLELVHKGLGEMQSLAQGVGDLKRVMTNVKARGTWGEVQLGSILEQVLAPDQYEKNVATKGGSERVEFVIRLPGSDDTGSEVVWLPIDAKFPQEDYLRLVEAADAVDEAGVAEAIKALVNRVKASAKDIHDKYINPPKTTDFAILFLPTEGLYAEVLRRPGLAEQLQRDYRVSLAGPTTLAALLNSLQMGFRTLAIQKRSSEVWSILGAVKQEFGKFGDVLDRVRKNIEAASKTIDDAGTRTRAIERRLRSVEALPAADAQALLPATLMDGADDGRA